MRLIQAIVILLMGFGYAGVTGWYPDVDWLQEPMLSHVWPIVVSGSCLVLVGVARLFRKGDPSIVGWIALSLAGCLLLFPLLLAKSSQTAIDQQAHERLLALKEDRLLEQRRQEQILREQIRREQREGPRDRFSQYEGRLDAVSLQAIRFLDERMQEAVQSRADAYESALENYPILGPSAWITFQSIEQLNAELEAHQRLYEATRAFTRFIETFEETYTAAIAELDLKPPADRVAIAEMERVLQSWEANQTYDLRKLEVEILAAALNALDVLKDQWGRWSFSPRDNQLSFEDPGMEARFQEAMQRFKFALDAVQAIRQETSAENVSPAD